MSMRRRTERGAGRVVHGFLTVNVCKIDLSITNNLKAVFAPTFRMWVEGREDEVTVVQVSKKAIPMYVASPMVPIVPQRMPAGGSPCVHARGGVLLDFAV